MTNTPVALITGAASGLGWALSQRLAKHYQVWMTDINATALQAKATQLGQPFLAADITQIADQQALVEALQKNGGVLHLLINCAGITHRSLAAYTQPQVFRQVMAVNYQAPIELTLACLPLLEAGTGKIVNIGSMAGWMPVLGRAGYCAAKSALHQFFETMRCEIRASGVSVLMVYPSFLDTPIEANALGHDGNRAAHARSTLGKVRSPAWMADKIARAIARNDERLFPDLFTRLASWLYALAPGLFERRMVQKFATELAPLPTKSVRGRR